MREADTACRLGGDEFALILPSCNADDALALAQRLASRLAALTATPGETITVSIGGSVGEATLIDDQTLVSTADRALLEAKANGKNTIVVTEATTPLHP